MEERSVSRRSFVAGAGTLAAGLAVGSLTGCSSSSTANSTTSTTESTDSSTPAWLGTAPAIAESEITDTLDCDVLVVGCGTSGLFAACSAAENGAKVIAIDKYGVSPGIRGTLGAVGTKWQKENGTEINPTDLYNDIAKYSSSQVNGNLTRLWIDNSAEAIEWYGDLCVAAGRQFVIDSDNDLPAEEQTGHWRHWCAGHAAVLDGKTAEDSTVLEDYATGKGVDFHWKTEMIELEKTGERVSGVIAQDDDDNYLRIKASKGVIVCTGGYALNDDMMTALQPDTKRIFSYNSGIAGAEGNGIRACMWAGADFDPTHTSMLFDRCPLGPDQIAGEQMVNGMFWMGSQPWLKVNLEGQRFADEGAPYDFILHASSTQPGHTYCTIWDSNFMNYIPQFKTQGCSRMFPFENGAPVSAITLDANMGMIQQLTEGGMIQQADTIEELAKKLNIPAENFSATVSRYNGLVASGTDTDFGKLAFRMSPVDTPPYYGIRQTGYLLCTMDGIPIDTNINALDKEGNPIEGLYVGGNDSGSFFAHSYPDLVPGLAAGRSATLGRRAGRIAATS